MIAIRNVVPFVITPVIGNYIESHDRVKIIVISQLILLVASVLIYVAYYQSEYWYLIYVYVLIQAICVCIKSSSYQYLIPNVVKSEDIEKANKIQALCQASVYVVGMGVGGIILSLFGDVSNLIIDNVVYFISIIIIIWFKYLVNKQNITLDLDNNTVMKHHDVTFRSGIMYMRQNTKFPLMIAVNAFTYYIYGIAEIINFKLGFEKYGVLILSIVLGLSTTGTVILYFGGSTRYMLNYLVLIIAISLYAVIEKYRIVPIWFFGLWMFTYVHYAFQIMMTTMIHKDADPKYKGRLFAYYYGATLILYAMGSFTGSYLPLYSYWMLMILSIIIIGILLIKFRYDNMSPDRQKLISKEHVKEYDLSNIKKIHDEQLQV